MSFMIFDSAGNAVDAFDDERQAVVALLSMVREDYDVIRHLAILAFDSAGEAVGEPVTVANLLPELATTLHLKGEGWIETSRLTFRSSSVTTGRREWRAGNRGVQRGVLA